jgi:hypothetical protein
MCVCVCFLHLHYSTGYVKPPGVGLFSRIFKSQGWPLMKELVLKFVTVVRLHIYMRQNHVRACRLRRSASELTEECVRGRVNYCCFRASISRAECCNDCLSWRHQLQRKKNLQIPCSGTSCHCISCVNSVRDAVGTGAIVGDQSQQQLSVRQWICISTDV